MSYRWNWLAILPITDWLHTQGSEGRMVWERSKNRQIQGVKSPTAMWSSAELYQSEVMNADTLRIRHILLDTKRLVCPNYYPMTTSSGRSWRGICQACSVHKYLLPTRRKKKKNQPIHTTPSNLLVLLRQDSITQQHQGQERSEIRWSGHHDHMLSFGYNTQVCFSRALGGIFLF